MSNKKSAAKAAKTIETPVVNNDVRSEMIAEVFAPAVTDVPQGTEVVTEVFEAPSALAVAASSVKALLTKPDATGGVGTLKAVTTKKDEAAIPANVLEELEGMGLNIVNRIKTLYAAGFTRTQIIACGYNSSTVYRQVGEYIKKLSEVKSEKAEVLDNAENLAAATDVNMPIVNSELAEDDLMEE